ncbi:MAG TPA: isocitrate lyase/PEP mutase family protein [Acidimicrobiales bacterium]|nr:isocitrate lyase/PEP mutase family protein [Acidimicrobiales bacterium]
MGHEARLALKRGIESGEGLFAPLCLDALTARLCEEIGFGCGYLSGGALGFSSGVSEALLTLTELAERTAAITRRSALPLIADGGVGFGDPVHTMRAVWDFEAAGAAAIEIEDQVAPKRVSHHRGIEHLVPAEEMAEKVRAAVQARKDPDFLIIARTSALRLESFDAAIARLTAYAEAGADLLLSGLLEGDELVRAPQLLPRPLIAMAPLDLRPREEWSRLGYPLVVDPYTGQSVAFDAMRSAFRAQHAGGSGPDEATRVKALYAELAPAAGLEELYEVERRTTEPGS